MIKNKFTKSIYFKEHQKNISKINSFSFNEETEKTSHPITEQNISTLSWSMKKCKGNGIKEKILKTNKYYLSCDKEIKNLKNNFFKLK